MGRIIMAGAALASLLGWIAWGFYSKWGPIAFDWAILHRVAQSTEPYAPTRLFAYPPPGLLAIRAIAGTPFVVGFFAWSFASAVLFIWGAWRLSNGVVAGLSLLSAPALQGLLLGQTSLLLSGGILLAFSASPLIGGAILGVIITIKPQLLLMLPLALVVRRDWTMLWAVAGGCSVSLTVSSAVLGFDTWRDWLSALPHFRQAVIDLKVLEIAITPASVAERFGSNPLLGWLAGIAVGGFAVCRLAPSVSNIDLVALIVASSVLASPYALNHDLAAIMPALAAYMLGRATWKALPAILLYVGWLVPYMLSAVVLFKGLKSDDADRD